ncbi:MAG: BBP7 family outer membrane beta-barrel protein, partial [Gemmataceae bacterium]
MPVGPSGEVIGIPANSLHSWRRPDGVPAMPASRNQASATSVAPPPVTGGPTTLVPPTPIGGAPTPSLPGAIGDTIGKGLTSPSIPSSPLPGQPGVPEIIPSPGVISGQPLPIPGGVIPTPGGVISGPVIGSIPGMPPAPGIPLGLGQGGTACDPSPASCAAWGDCGDCCDRPKFTIGGEFLLWWTKGDQTPALVTAAPPGQAPLLINPATTIMYGGNQLADGARPGGRIFGTYWFGNDNLWGMDASGFFLGNDNQSNYTIENAGNVYSLGRPFSDTSSGALVPSVEEVAGPGLAGGVVISRQ